MVDMLVVGMHVGGAIGAFLSGFFALRFPNGTRTHRRLGKSYLGAWLVLFVSGVVIGWGNPGLSIFEVLNVLGISCVLVGYNLIRFRRRVGVQWLRFHYNCMISSLAFLVVAAVNQVLPRLGVAYPWWGIVVLSILPFFVIPPYIARLDRHFMGKQQGGGAQLTK